MNKGHRCLIPSLSLLLVGSLFGCTKTNSNDALFTVKTNATITFNAIEGIGKWGSTGTSIRTLTLLKGYSWGYIRENLKSKEQIIEGKDIDVIESGTRQLVESAPWLYNGQKIQDDYIVSDDIILNANYDPVYIGVTFVASPETEEPSHHLIDGEKTKVVSANDKIIQKGTKWKEIKDDYIPICLPDYGSEPFLYYQNSDGLKVSDEYVLKDNDTLTAVYLIDHPQNFMTDSWETISAAANLGLKGDYSMSSLKYEQGGYYEDYKRTEYEYHNITYTKNAETFVGLRHEVQIGKKIYDAVVIGENVDKVSNTANATLTFQIEQIVNTNKSYDTLEHNLNRYSESALRSYLNENFIYTLSPDLQNVIVPVNKRTNWGGKEESQGDVRESMDYIYAFSLAELGIGATTTGEVEAEGFGDTHKEAYMYYQIHKSDSDRIRRPLNNDGTAMTYWLRSPDCDVTGFAWAISETGAVVDTSRDITLASGVVCGFSVGAKR